MDVLAAIADSQYVPPQFANCPYEYRGEEDDKYLYCQLPPRGSFCQMIEEMHQAKDFRRYFLAIIPLILSVFAIMLNLAFVGILLAVIRQNGHR